MRNIFVGSHTEQVMASVPSFLELQILLRVRCPPIITLQKVLYVLCMLMSNHNDETLANFIKYPQIHPCLHPVFGPPFTPHLLVVSESKEILLNLSMKCWNSVRNAEPDLVFNPFLVLRNQTQFWITETGTKTNGP